jgi:D-alanyl-D-alanine carboxypeptidase
MGDPATLLQEATVPVSYRPSRAGGRHPGRAITAAALFAVLLAGCSSLAGSGTSSTAPSSSTGAPAARCPAGTTNDGRLCVADGDAARQTADIIRSTFKDDKLGAVVAGVWQHGHPVVVGALGETLTGVPATVDMHHVTGNISSSMLVTAFLQLVDQGTLALDDKLSKWYPHLPKANAITLAMLARSMTGYAHFPASKAFLKKLYADPFQYWNPDALIAFGTGAGEPKFEPGTDFLFADTNLMILSQVVQKAAGRPLSELIQDHILAPLGMSNTTPPQTANLPDPVLHGYTGERGVWEDSTYWNPTWILYNGGMGSTQHDLRVFIEAVGSGRLVSKKSHQEQLAPTTVGLDGNTADRYYAMGIVVTNGWLVANPTMPGYRGIIARLPGKDITIVIYNTNTQVSENEPPQASTMFHAIATLLAPDQPPKPI